MEAIQEFRDFIAGLGYEPPQRIEPGRFFRFQTNGKRRDDAGYCKLFPDGEGGIVGDFRTGACEVWQANRAQQFTESERRAWIERIEREKQAVKAEEARRRAEAAKQAQSIYSGARVATDGHPYLAKKNIKANGAHVYRGDLVIRDMKCDGALIVPLRNTAGAIQTLEFISPDGEKRFLPGGKKTGHYFGLGKPNGSICVAEGFATGASVYETTGHAVAIAFDADNLKPVAQALRVRFPELRLVVCADDDAWTEGNPGITKATEAARAVGGLVAIPDFGSDRAEGETDFNDLAQKRGAEAVREALAGAKPPAVPEAQALSENASEGWPEPRQLPVGLPPVAAFDFALLPDSLQPWARDICERVQCPADFIGVTVMAALGSVIGRKVGIRPQAQTDWTETPNQWAFIVGRPGVLKSPAMEAALSPLKRLASLAVESYSAEAKEYQQTAKLAKLRAEASEKAARTKLAKSPTADVSGDLVADETEEPVLKRYIANDTSAESLGELLRQNPNGLLVFRDELVSLLRVLDREDNASSKGFYLTGWNGNSAYTFDRIGRGLNLHIPAVCLSLLGSTQPGRISEYLRAAVKGGAGDDGMIQRFGLLVWPDTSGTWRDVDRWPDSEARRLANAVFETLDTLNPAKIRAEQGEFDDMPYLRFDDEGLELFRGWREQFEVKLRAGDLHAALESHLSKYRKLVPGLALILHLSSAGTGPVTRRAVLQALAWAQYLETHARRAYASVTSPEIAAAKAILEKVRRGELPRSFAARDIYRQGWAYLDREQAIDALQLLVDLDWLSCQSRDTNGRTATVYEVNPRGLAS